MLPVIRFELDVSGAERAIDALGDALDDEFEAVVRRAGDRIAQTARARHPYTDRTGTLTGSLAGLPPTGRLRAGSLEGGATAAAEYASFVEHGTSRNRPYPFLGPAGEAAERDIEQDAEDALERAVVRSGVGR